ncbi:MAG TPA: choice-of-anchor D domain-containing protein [Pseudonocardiaceae bacterium]|jgi:Tol biopolymer transport system component
MRRRPVIVVLAAFLLAVQTLTSATPLATAAQTSLTLASAGSDGKPAPTESGQAALAADGTQTAFVSAAPLKVSGSVPQTAATDSDQPFRVYARNRLAGTTTLLSDAGTGSAAAPTISATGRLVAYEADNEITDENQIDVVDRLATGRGKFDTAGNLVRTQVTGNAGDPRYQRIEPCSINNEALGLGRCGPHLSEDGSTLAYQAQLSPVSPGLAVGVSEGEGTDPAEANLVDFVSAEETGFGGAEFGILSETVSYFNLGTTPIRWTAPPVATAPFHVSGTSCDGDPTTVTLGPDRSCDVTVTVDATASCPRAGVIDVLSGELTTTATTPDGQTGVGLAAMCSANGDITDEAPAIPLVTTPSSVAAGCAPVPTGLPLVAAPQAAEDNEGTPVVDTGAVEVGRPDLQWTTITGIGLLDFDTPDCAVQLVDPVTAKPAGPLPADQPPPCRQNQELGNEIGENDVVPTSCTAYLLVDPQQVATTESLLSLDNVECFFECDQFQNLYVAVTGVRNVVVAKRGPGFTSAVGTVISVDSAGRPIPDATQPSLSTNGRYVAFTAGTEVFRHDTDTAGNGTHRSGATSVVSCQPGAGACRPLAGADFPSISGDGTRIAFLGSVNQVYVRETVPARTLLVSSDRGGGTKPSDGQALDPVISQDGSTIAFSSVASDVLNPPLRFQALNLYLADIGPGTAGVMAVTPDGGPVTGSTAIVQPSLDAHGRIVAFETTRQLLPGAPSDVDSVYTFERFGHLVISPGSVSYGRLIAGLPGQTRTVTVTNTGLGPVTFTGVRVGSPFLLSLESCVGEVLHHGQKCSAIVLFRPVRAGHPTGVLTWTTADDGEPPQQTGVDLGATVVVPTVPLLTVSPTIAYGGEVVRATGVAFPANSVVTLSWNVGLGRATASVGANGQFAVDVVIFPDDVLGARSLLAAGPTGTVLASASFLAAANPEEPPFHRAGS